MSENELKEPALRAYRAMCLARAFDTKISALYKAGKIFGGVFLGRGHEAVAAGEAVFLQPGRDVYAPFIREMAGRCVWGENAVLEAARAYFGSAAGCMGGKDGNVHWGMPTQGTPAPISHLGAMVSVVAGMVLAKRMKGEQGCVGVACIGDGTTSVGATHEACNLIAVEKLPVVVVVTNNQFAYSTPNSAEFACADLAERGRGYGMVCHSCDGTDLMATLATMRSAVEGARSGGGPRWVVADTLRMCGHGEHDDAAYVPAELKAAYSDPVVVARQQLMERGWLTEQADAELAEACRLEVQTQVAAAQREAAPSPAELEWNALSQKPAR